MKNGLIIGTSLCLLLLAGCGSAEETGSSGKAENTVSSAEGTKITITDFADRTITFDENPQKIVVLGDGDLNLIVALDGNIVGRPTTSGEVPEALKDIEQVGNTHEFDLEKIASIKPDVVVANSQLNVKDVEALEGIGSKVVLTNANSVQEIQEQITLYGDMLGQQNKAKELNAEITETIDSISISANGESKRVLLVYGAPGTYMAALPNSLSGNILELAGGANIASDYPALEKYPQYAQLNTERIVEANPEFIFLMTHADPEAVKAGFIKEMQQNPAWNGTDAVKNDKVEILPADLFGTNPGTRVTDAISYIGGLLHSAE
ncbi:MAG: ABC transporter substrate-binding protein [Bacillus sp. (in: firmicutes)]